jgi:MoxR-like ATPase
MEYMAQLVRETRHDSRVLLGASPRALVNLLYASKARASLEGRAYVTPDDVKDTVQDTLNHRIILKPQVIAQATRDGDIWVYDIIDRILSDILSRVPVPR